eukprot:SAG22_NODE_453_length_10316_cov_27.583341_8_plen_320_part_00
MNLLNHSNCAAVLVPASPRGPVPAVGAGQRAPRTSMVPAQAAMARLLLAAAAVLTVSYRPADAACTCPEDATTCGLGDLLSTSGDEDCSAAGGVLDADLLVASATVVTLEFGGLVRVAGDVSLQGNTVLATAYLRDLINVDGGLQVIGNPELVSMPLESLATVGADISVQSNVALLSLQLLAFTSTSGDSGSDAGTLLSVESNAALETLLLPSLQATQRSLAIGGTNAQQGNPALHTVDLSALVTAGGSMRLSGNAVLERLELGALQTVGQFFYIGSTGKNPIVCCFALLCSSRAPRPVDEKLSFRTAEPLYSSTGGWR